MINEMLFEQLFSAARYTSNLEWKPHPPSSLFEQMVSQPLYLLYVQ